MRLALLTLLCCAFVTALSGEDAVEKRGGPRGGGKVSQGGKNIGNGDGGGIGIDTGGGDIRDIGVGIGGGGGGGGGCRQAGDQSGYCNNGSGTPSLLGLILGQTTASCVCIPTDCDPQCASGLTCCNGACTDLSNNPSNCGSCGNTCPSGSISACSSGTLACDCDPPSSSCSGQCCASGLTCCSGACTDLNNNLSNCGSCGNTCPAESTCSSGACICTIFQGFQGQATFPTGSRPQDVTVGDFNGDGYLDIVASNAAGSTLSVLLGTGSGSFQPQSTYPVGSEPLGVAVGDFNGDDYLDIVTANAGGNTVSVLLGKPCGA